MKNRNDVAIALEEEGIEYFLTSYCGPTDMPDEELKRAFEKALAGIEAFEKLLPEADYNE